MPQPVLHRTEQCDEIGQRPVHVHPAKNAHLVHSVARIPSFAKDIHTFLGVHYHEPAAFVRALLDVVDRRGDRIDEELIGLRSLCCEEVQNMRMAQVLENAHPSAEHP